MNLPPFINDSLMTETYLTHLAAPACMLPNPHITKLFQWQQVNKLSQAPEMYNTSDSWTEDARRKETKQISVWRSHIKICLWMTNNTYEDNRTLLLLGALNSTGKSEGCLVLLNWPLYMYCSTTPRYQNQVHICFIVALWAKNGNQCTS